MKVFLILLFFSSVSCAISKNEFCKETSELAEAIMIARQYEETKMKLVNRHLTDDAITNEFVKNMVEDAYEYKVGHNHFSKRKHIKHFKYIHFSSCMEY